MNVNPAKAVADIAVFCGSNRGVHPEYAQQARNLGKGLALSRFRLIYGSGDVGLMGEVVRSVMQHGGEAIGVTSKRIMEIEAPTANLTALIKTETLHERKAVMAANSDATVILPGGLGTMDEFAETLSLRALEYHFKPILLVNINGYFDNLIAFIDTGKDEQFIKGDLHKYFTVCDDTTQAISILASHFVDP